MSLTDTSPVQHGVYLHISRYHENKKVHYCEEHSAFIVLSWCIVTFLGKESLGG